ncbi:SET and MYND domain-containing protein 4 isoform X1 [Drosophila albomicans]|uniref:SET and MYND domain-containing protein 4 isoform X1 n=2 Tax=Drosophila albomicans TaxID=7291 RepID=A0A6P8Y238_DROAB|nr:SET and MYND domain-containing protein 4 isoform X1 [Drosophila albomicans]
MFGLAEAFSRQSELIQLTTYENEFETIKSLHTLPKDKQRHFNALTIQLLDNLEQPANKESCAQTSRSLREEGNRVYKSKCDKNAAEAKECLLAACRIYTQAILEAEDALDELALGFANRGMALQDFGYFQQAYDDCACALEFGYPHRLQHKLVMRQAHCAWQLGNVQQLAEHLSILKKLPLNDGYAKQLEQLKQQLEILEANPNNEQLPAIPAVHRVNHKILSTPAKGRHMIATTALKKDELIFTEQAQCFVPIEQRLICQQCAASLLCAPIPCPACHQRVVYCSRNCRQLHANIHIYECGAYRRNLLGMIGVSHLALRLLLKHLPEWIKQLPTENSHNAKELWQALVYPAATEDSPSLQSLRMITQLHKAPQEELVYHALCANLLQVYLFSCTSFYEDLKMANHTDWHLVIAALILRNAGQLLVNGHVGNALVIHALPSNEFPLLQPAMWQRPYHLKRGYLHKFSNRELITAINLPLLSLCNHACNPSLRTTFDGCMVNNYAAFHIAAGEEIFNCYSLDYKHSLSEQRQQQLLEIYKFRCDCSKCVRPEADADYLNFHRYRCELCKQSFVPKVNLNWWQQSDEILSICCTACDQTQQLTWYDQFLQLLERCDEPRDRRKLYEAFAALNTWLLEFNSLKLSLAKELIGGCFAAKDAGATFADYDYAELSKIIEFELAGIAAQRGSNSLLYISNATYLLDLIAWGKHKANAKQLPAMRSSFAFLAKETREIFVNYYNDFIEQ